MGLEKIICMGWSYNSETLKVLLQKYLVANMPCAANNGEEKNFLMGCDVTSGTFRRG